MNKREIFIKKKPQQYRQEIFSKIKHWNFTKAFCLLPRFYLLSKQMRS